MCMQKKNKVDLGKTDLFNWATPLAVLLPLLDFVAAEMVCSLVSRHVLCSFDLAL